MPMYRSDFPDTIGIVTPKGLKFNFRGQLLDTENPDIIAVLKERIEYFKDVKEIDADEANALRAEWESSQAKVSVEDQMSANPEGQTTISPQELMRRVQLANAAESAARTQSAQLATPAGTLNPQAGVVSSATLEAAAPSDSAPAAAAGAAVKVNLPAKR